MNARVQQTTINMLQTIFLFGCTENTNTYHENFSLYFEVNTNIWCNIFQVCIQIEQYGVSICMPRGERTIHLCCNKLLIGSNTDTYSAYVISICSLHSSYNTVFYQLHKL